MESSIAREKAISATLLLSKAAPLDTRADSRIRVMQPIGRQASMFDMKSNVSTVSGSTGMHSSGFARTMTVERYSRWLIIPYSTLTSALAAIVSVRRLRTG
eukprot:3938188-Rhodomonas_salina.3